ncbi:MAG: MBL fold metallo-hydrolase [Chloroflexi bacterium]|nr:MBL fold metallo-hydrolase [Chloroflexota bacterium]
MYLQQLFVEGLGHASYLLASDQTREAAVVDPRRDIDTYLVQARRQGFQMRYVVETHVHNDFVSGARHLAQCTGAEHVAPAQAELHYAYRGVREGDELRLGELVVRALATPGHTPEHVTYVVVDTARAEQEPVLAFTGGDLLVGSVGRPDLLGEELGRQLAPRLYESLHQKILRLPDYVLVLPTHGAGSLCGRGIAGARCSTIGYERHFNPALQQKTSEAFVRWVLGGSPGIPTYYQRLRPLNQAGAAPFRAFAPRPLPPLEVQRLARQGALVLDARHPAAFGGAHIPGALNVWLGPMFQTWVGWLVPHDIPLVFVFERDEDWPEATTMLARIGHERCVGYLQLGMSTWQQQGLPLDHVPQLSVQQLEELIGREPALQLLDVRMDSEWQAGYVPGAKHVMLGDLPARLGELDRGRSVAAYCGSGNRSSTATALLKRHGFTTVFNVLGGMAAWRAAGYEAAGVSGQ